LHALNLVLFEQIRNQKTNRTIFSSPKFSLSVVTSWQFPFGFISMYFHPGAEIMAKYSFISFYTAEKMLFSCQVRHKFMAETVTPTFSQQLSVHHVSCSQYHRITESQNSRGWKGPLWVI